MPVLPVNVPMVAGVPSVNFAAGFILPTLLTQDAVTPFASVYGPQWGIFQSGALVITAESVTGWEFRNDWTISDYPVEGGQFESYDKVLLPFLAKVRFASGSTSSARASLLSQVAAAAAAVAVYDAVTPEFTYLSCSIAHYDYRREASRGVGLIVIDVWLSQIIQQNSGTLTAAGVQNPASADPSQNGLVQPQSSSQSNVTFPPVQDFN